MKIKTFVRIILLVCLTAITHSSWAKIHTLDILVLHPPKTTLDIDALTRAASMETYANKALENSQAEIRYRVVKVVEFDLPNPKTDVATLRALKDNTQVQQLRSQYGADIVTMITPTGPYCGVGYILGGRNDKIYAVLKGYAYNVVGDRCISSFAHEVGHNLGLGHSYKQNSNGGLYVWGRGHGVDNNFVTTMAYTSAYNARRVQFFSNPAVLKCNGLACGVDLAQVNGADAVRAINVSGPQIAAWFDSKVPEAVANHAPTANDDFAVTKAGEVVYINVLENDVDADQDVLSIVEVGTAKHGQVAVNGDSIRYAPASGYVGQDNFQYTITDGNGHNASAWVTVNVGWGVHYQYFEGTWNQLPDFSTLTPVVTGISHNFSLESRQRDQGFGMHFHAQILIPATGDYAFDVNTTGLAKVDIDGQDVAFPNQPGRLALTAGLHRIVVDFVSVGSNPQMQVGWQGPGFKHQLIPSDALRLAEPVNSFPVAADDTVQMTTETQILIDVLANDSDTDGDILHLAGFTQPDHGSVSQQDNKLLYQPDAGFNGQDVFSYQVSDGRGGEDYGQVTVTVGRGLSYVYYEGNWQRLPDFDNLVPVATGVQNDFSLVNRNRDDHFAFRFRATLKLPQDGNYYFFLISDGGSRLIIDNETVADLDGIHSMRWAYVAKNYSVGMHDLELQYFDYTGREQLYLYWRGPDMRWQRLDGRYLVPR